MNSNGDTKKTEMSAADRIVHGSILSVFQRMIQRLEMMK